MDAACSGEPTGLAYIDASLKPVVAHYEMIENERRRPTAPAEPPNAPLTNFQSSGAWFCQAP